MFEKLYNLSNKFCNERKKTYIKLLLLNHKVYIYKTQLTIY